MPFELIVEEDPSFRRAALVDRNRLVDLAVDRTGAPRLYQSIWRVKIDRIMPKMGAFALLDADKTGLFKGAATLQSGTVVTAQIKSLRSEGKAHILTTDIALPGRFFVYLPNAHGLSISRKIDPAQSEPLIAALNHAGTSGGIVRTAASRAAVEDIIAEAQSLHAYWETIETKDIGLLAEGPDAPTRLISDYGGEPLKQMAASFEERGLEGQFQTLLASKVELSRGGSLIIEATRALTAIDVNAADQATADINREAVAVAAQQIRARNLSGLIVIDFAGDVSKDIYTLLEKTVASDPAGCRLLGISPAGLVEMTRQRRDLPLSEIVNQSVL